MKKLLTLALSAFMAWGAASAQVAFHHVGVSIEAGTSGLGANLSIPIITNHVIFTVGYNFPTLDIRSDFELKGNNISEQMGQAVNAINAYNAYAHQAGLQPIQTAGLQTTFGKTSTEVTAQLNFTHWKFLLELYPSMRSNFHLTAGIYMSQGRWLDLSGEMDMVEWSGFRDVVRAHDQLEAVVKEQKLQDKVKTHPAVREAAKFSLGDEAFYIDPETGKIDAGITVRRIKPYVGIGFGSSVPMHHRMGFQMELGAYYQGLPKLESLYPASDIIGAESSEEIENIWDTGSRFSWYPTLTLRWTGRLF